MEEVENIKRLLLSDDSKELGLELAKSLNLVNEVVKAIDRDFRKRIDFLNLNFKSWKIVLKSTTIDYGFNGLNNSTYNYQIECLLKNKNTQVIKGSQDLYHFAKKREDLIKELNK